MAKREKVSQVNQIMMKILSDLWIRQSGTAGYTIKRVLCMHLGDNVHSCHAAVMLECSCPVYDYFKCMLCASTVLYLWTVLIHGLRIMSLK